MWLKEAATTKVQVAVEIKGSLEEDPGQSGHSGIRPGRQNMNYSNIKSQVPQDSDSYKTTTELLMGKACLGIKN